MPDSQINFSFADRLPRAGICQRLKGPSGPAEIQPKERSGSKYLKLTRGSTRRRVVYFSLLHRQLVQPFTANEIPATRVTAPTGRRSLFVPLNVEMLKWFPFCIFPCQPPLPPQKTYYSPIVTLLIGSHLFHNGQRSLLSG